MLNSDASFHFRSDSPKPEQNEDDRQDPLLNTSSEQCDEKSGSTNEASFNIDMTSPELTSSDITDVTYAKNSPICNNDDDVSSFGGFYTNPLLRSSFQNNTASHQNSFNRNFVRPDYRSSIRSFVARRMDVQPSGNMTSFEPSNGVMTSASNIMTSTPQIPNSVSSQSNAGSVQANGEQHSNVGQERNNRNDPPPYRSQHQIDELNEPSQKPLKGILKRTYTQLSEDSPMSRNMPNN